MNLTRDLFIPLVDANALRKAVGVEAVGEGNDWVRIDKSTIFELAFNPQEETQGYIDTANDTTYVKSYQVGLPQEIILDNENPLYKVMFPFCMKMPTGSSAVVPVLLVTPSMTTGEATDGHLWKDAIVSPGSLNTVDGKLTFELKLNGDKQEGTVSFEGGKATFSGTDSYSYSGYSVDAD